MNIWQKKFQSDWPIYILFALLFCFIFGFRIIPFWNFWGLDIQCIHAFHNCAGHANSPYLVDGSVCGDALGRPMVYPPLHYWFFAWTRFLNFRTTAIFWSICIGVLLLASLPLWTSKEDRSNWKTHVFWILLIAQYPTIFHMERGSNEMPVLICFALSMIFYLRKNLFWSGLLAGMCAITKVYPIFFVAVLCAGLLKDQNFKSFLKGVVAGVGIPTLLTFNDSLKVFLEVIPRHASSTPAVGDDALVSHSVMSLFPDNPWLSRGLFFSLLGLSCWQAKKHFEKMPQFFFYFAILLSNYLATVSFDYQLILVYPLMIYLAALFLRTHSVAVLTLLTGGILVYFFDRTILIVNKFTTILTWGQVIWMLVLVLSMPRLLAKITQNCAAKGSRS